MVFRVHPNWYLMGNVMSWWIFWHAGLFVFVGSGPMLLWGLIPHCLMCVNWRERNARSFEDIEHSNQELKQSFLIVLFEWANASGLFHFHSLYELINSCQFPL